MKILVFYREINMDSQICLELLKYTYGEKNITSISINYNYFVKPDTKNYTKVYVVGINLNPDNKLFIGGLCQDVLYFEQDEVNSSILRLLEHFNLESMSPDILDRYKLVDAYQRGAHEDLGDKAYHFNRGLKYKNEKDNKLLLAFTDSIVYEEIMNIGSIIYDAEASNLKALNNRLVRSVQFKGLPALIANYTGDDIFRFTPNLESYSMCITYSRNKSGKINVRLQTNNPEVDVRVIATEFSGGGPSSKIAGFRCDILPNELLFQICNVPYPEMKDNVKDEDI